MTRINCHSAFKHYEMFHNNCCGGGSYGSIFNQTVNVNCGGHGGFWSGFGLGLGNAFGNIFGGFLGGGFGNFGFGGGFGNFGMGGFGFPSFGGFGGWGGFGGGWGNFWGGTPGISSSTTNSTCTCGCKDKKTTDTNHECKDPDLKKINDYDTKVLKLEKTPNETEAKKLYKDIKDSMDKQDDTHKAENTIAYQKLLDRLKAKYPNIDAAESESDKESEGAGAGQGATGAGQGAAGAGQGTAGAGQGAAGAGQNDDTVKIGDQDVKVSELTAEQIKNLTADQIKNLTPEQAKLLLGKLNLLCKDDDGKEGIKATTNYKALLLTQRSGLDLACGHNTALDNVAGADAYLHGKIYDVKLNGTTITFIIETENGKYKMSCEADSKKYQIAKLVENKTNKYKSVTIGTEYEIKEDGDDDHAVRNGAAAIK